jgi:hypothetical protein
MPFNWMPPVTFGIDDVVDEVHRCGRAAEGDRGEHRVTKAVGPADGRPC